LKEESMKMESISFVGGGRVARILIGGLERVGALPGKVLVYDPDETVGKLLTSLYPAVELVKDTSIAASADVIFLAIHPPEIGGVMSRLAEGLRDDSVLVSLAPVVTIHQMVELSGGHTQIVRMIPNAPSLVGKGYNPVAFSDGIDNARQTALVDLFSRWGPCPLVEEEHLELYAVVAAMGPTYLWPLLFALEGLARTFGLEDKAARDAVTNMTEGAVAVLERSRLSEEEIMDLIPVKPLAEATAKHVENSRETLAELVKKLSPAVKS
jgi:pyrroline-5-carboxylate reductase